MVSRTLLLLVSTAAIIACVRSNCDDAVFKESCEKCEKENPGGKQGSMEKSKVEDLTPEDQGFISCFLKENKIIDEAGNINDANWKSALQKYAECMNEGTQKIDKDRWEKEVGECHTSCDGETDSTKKSNKFWVCAITSYKACHM